MVWGFYGGLLCIAILLALIAAIMLTPTAPDSELDDECPNNGGDGMCYGDARWHCPKHSPLKDL